MKIRKYLIEGPWGKQPNWTRTPNYKVGSIIEYRPLGGGLRTVKVDYKDSDIKDGYPGFEGILVDPKTYKPIKTKIGSSDVWGYDDQITRVIKK